MGKIAPRWAKTASRCGNIVVRKSQKERERERETAKTETETEKTETETTETETDRDRQRERRERGERERERDGVAGHVQDGSPDFGVYQVYARAVSPLLEKDAPGTVRPPSREGCYRDARSPGPRLAQGGVVRPPTD